MSALALDQADSGLHGEGALAVETVSITKRFGDLTALEAASVRVHAGSVHALLGRERRRQIDLGQMHHGLLPARRG